MCLLKRNVSSNDDEIFDTIKNSGITYYRYYAILINDEEKTYVSKFSEAEDIVNQLKEKQSSNMEQIAINEKYETELKEFTTVADWQICMRSQKQLLLHQIRKEKQLHIIKHQQGVSM